VSNSPAARRILVTGYISDTEMANWYARASIFAFPSLDEGFGIPVLEAMAHGVAVITSDCSALPEVAGNAALLVDPKNVDAIAAALLDLASSPERRRELSEAGRMRAELFKWRRAVDQTYGVYQELLR